MAEKILCVDDELNILLALQRQLRKQFHLDSALGAEKALAAIERALQLRPDHPPYQKQRERIAMEAGAVR